MLETPEAGRLFSDRAQNVPGVRVLCERGREFDLRRVVLEFDGQLRPADYRQVVLKVTDVEADFERLAVVLDRQPLVGVAYVSGVGADVEAVPLQPEDDA